MKEWLWSHAKILIGIFIASMFAKLPGFMGKALSTLGLSFIAYKYVMPEIKSYLNGLLAGLPQHAYELVIYCKVDVAAVLILSAVAVSLTSKLFLSVTGGASS